MKVWIVFEFYNNGQDSCVSGVFSSKERAEEMIEKLLCEGHHFFVEEFEVE